MKTIPPLSAFLCSQISCVGLSIFLSVLACLLVFSLISFCSGNDVGETFWLYFLTFLGDKVSQRTPWSSGPYSLSALFAKLSLTHRCRSCFIDKHHQVFKMFLVSKVLIKVPSSEIFEKIFEKNVPSKGPFLKERENLVLCFVQGCCQIVTAQMRVS